MDRAKHESRAGDRAAGGASLRDAAVQISSFSLLTVMPGTVIREPSGRLKTGEPSCSTPSKKPQIRSESVIATTGRLSPQAVSSRGDIASSPPSRKSLNVSAMTSLRRIRNFRTDGQVGTTSESRVGGSCVTPSSTEMLLNILTPIPIDAIVADGRSTRIPASLALSTRTSFIKRNRRPLILYGRRASMIAAPATRGSNPQCREDLGSIGTFQVAHNPPNSPNQVRLNRPLPRVWRSLLTTVHGERLRASLNVDSHSSSSLTFHLTLTPPFYNTYVGTSIK